MDSEEGRQCVLLELTTQNRNQIDTRDQRHVKFKVEVQGAWRLSPENLRYEE